MLLWEEYVRDCKKKGKHFCTYPTFCLHYRKYTVKKSYTSHIVRKPGETIEVDWSGPTMYFYNPETKEITFYDCYRNKHKIHINNVLSLTVKKELIVTYKDDKGNTKELMAGYIQKQTEPGMFIKFSEIKNKQ